MNDAAVSNWFNITDKVPPKLVRVLVAILPPHRDSLVYDVGFIGDNGSWHLGGYPYAFGKSVKYWQYIQGPN